MKKLAIIVIALFSAAAFVSAQQKQRVAVLPSIGDLDPQRLILLTDKVRELATQNLPMENFNILKQDVITKLIGEEELYRSCKEGVCIGDLAKKTDANYGARCDVIKFDNRLVLKFEIYSVNEEAIFETFIDDDVKDFRGMFATLEARLPDAFKKMVDVQNKTLADGRARPTEQTQQQPTVVAIQQPAPQTEEPKVPKVKKPRKHDWYFVPRYALSIGGMPAWGAINLESGLIWGKGTFFGIDIDGGYGRVNEKGGLRRSEMVGAGLNLGGIYDLPIENLQFIYGGSIGFWFSRDDIVYDNLLKQSYDFLAPFIKFRWNFVELSYRGLLGIHSNIDYSGDNSYKYGDDLDLNHQVMLGAYFATSKRVR